MINEFGNAGQFRSREESDLILAKEMDDSTKAARDGGYMDEMPWALAWQGDPDIGRFLDAHLFVEKDQVVVPTLNLKAAKRVVCRNERQKKALRKMGFIEDRIQIRNLK